jgi:hypothetical protein
MTGLERTARSFEYQNIFIPIRRGLPWTGACRQIVSTEGKTGHIFDIAGTLEFKTAQVLQISHIALDRRWDSKVFAGSPDASEATVVLNFPDAGGVRQQPESCSVPAHGSIKVEAFDLTERARYRGDDIEFNPSQSVSAFRLCGDIACGVKDRAGVGDVDSQDRYRAGHYIAQCSGPFIPDRFKTECGA